MIPILRILGAVAGSDRDLLDRYVRNRDEGAFEALVRRYGAGVWAACVRLAGRDAEDAFQAVFLILSRKAGTVTGALPAWLHAVARRVASTLRRDARRRSAVEAGAARPDLMNGTDPSLREGLALLDEELARLPERYRSVLIVCCLEGRSRDEAAVQLGWSEGQVKGRLERARVMLRTRLARRGVELGGVLLAAAVGGPVPARAGPPSAAAITLTHGVIRAMLIQKFRLTVIVLAACVGVPLAGGVILRAQPGEPPPTTANALREMPENRAGAAGPQIVVTSPQATDVVVARQYVGKILASRHVDVCAQVAGIVAEVPVKEGQTVKKGDVLFKVGPAIYQAKLDAEIAELQIAKLELSNAKKLFEQKVISQQEVARSEARVAKAEARTKLAKAELDSTVVRAPFDGHVGRLLEREGSAVKEGAALTTLSDNGAVRVYFNVPEARYLEFMTHRDQLKEGSPVELVLANGRKFPHAGKLAAIDGQFDKDTGSIAFRADFPNPEGLLRHGQSGTVLTRELVKNAVVIPQRATFEDGNRRYVYVVGKDNVAHRREVLVRNELKGLFVIDKGLEVNDRIVVDGVQQVRDGEMVKYEFRKPDEVIGIPKRP